MHLFGQLYGVSSVVLIAYLVHNSAKFLAKISYFLQTNSVKTNRSPNNKYSYCLKKSSFFQKQVERKNKIVSI